MDRDLFKAHILCQIFPKTDGIYLGVVFTPSESLVCYATSVLGLKKSLSTAVQEVCDHIDGRISEDDFVNALREREVIMRGIIKKHGIPLHPDLYYCLTEYFPEIQESYRPIEYLLQEKVFDEEIEMPSLSSRFAPMWDGQERKFISVEKSLPFILLCERLTLAVLKATHWEPVSGEIYYHPTYWNAKDRMFVPISNQAAFDECPYPAFQTEEECQTVCDTLTVIMLKKG